MTSFFPCTQDGSGPYTTSHIHSYPWLVRGWHVFWYSVFRARISLILLRSWCWIFLPYMATAMNCILVCVILTTSVQTPRIRSAQLLILALATRINDGYVAQVNFISTSLIRLNAFVLRSGNDYVYCVSFHVRKELHTDSRTQSTKPPAPLTGCRRFCTTFVAYRNTALSNFMRLWGSHKCFIQRRSQLPELCTDGGSWMKYVYGSLVERYWQDKTGVLWEVPIPAPLCPPTDLRSNQGFHSVRPTTNSLSCGMITIMSTAILFPISKWLSIIISGFHS